MGSRLLAAVALVMLTLGYPSLSAGAPVVIDFEGLDAMHFVSREPIPEAARLSDAYLTAHGVRFASGSPYVAVVNLGAGHATSGTNGIGGSTSSGDLTYDRVFPIVAAFFDPANPAIPAITEFVSVRGDMIGHGAEITLNAYDLAGSLIASDTTSDSGGATLVVSAAGIHSVEFLGTHDDGGVAIDDFTFEPVTTSPVSTQAQTWGEVKARFRSGGQ